MSTAVGAGIAFAGTMVADLGRARGQRRREQELDRWQHGIDFLVALDAAHGLLREVARSRPDPGELPAAVAEAMGESGLYGAREKLLIAGTPQVVRAAEVVVGRLVAIRNAVRSGATLDSRSYHDAYHDYAESLWAFRMVVRKGFGHRTIAPSDLDRPDWSERAHCRVCAADGS
ncbi:hypothetical protein J2S41_002065 [Catenuloplanes atrovinosus]|uniref:Uncharacterized protein n=1 Tax=Catenuloplanes atrovinosus TaxID=137266 RepID=A0AAE3YLQ3_9ACTN|nr:hypothetical protein [Catenuloplanes atrovinosus]